MAPPAEPTPTFRTLMGGRFGVCAINTNPSRWLVCKLHPCPLDRALKLAVLVVRQVDDDGVFIEASELRRVIVGFAEDGMKEHFACALHYDLASRPAHF
jgi:hypothetical protein